MSDEKSKKKKPSIIIKETREQLHSGSLMLGIILGAVGVAGVLYASKTGVLGSREAAFQVAARNRMLAASIPFRSAAVPIPTKSPCPCSTLVI